MNRVRAWGLSAALAAGAGGPALAADPPLQQTTVYAKLFGPKPQKPGPTAAAGRVPTVTAPLPADVVADALRAEQDAWDRRMAVCLRLREDAAAANDDALMRQVDEIERQAAALYAARTAALGLPKTRAPLPEPAAAVLDRQLGTGAAVTPLTAPAPPVPADATRTAAARPQTPPAGGGVRP